MARPRSIATRPRSTPSWGGRLLQRAASPLAIVLIWELASRTGWLPATILAAPSQIGQAFWQLLVSGELPRHLLASGIRALAGATIGIAIGALLALLAGLSRAGETVVDAPMQMLRTLPGLALVPLFILWLGVGESMKIAMIAFGTAFPIYLTLFAGIRGVDVKLIEMARNLGLSRGEVIWHVILPGALPTFFVGLRFALAGAWLALVVVEQVNAVVGIGFLANDARDFARTDVIVVCLLVYSLLGLGVDLLVRALERRALAWRRSLVDAR